MVLDSARKHAVTHHAPHIHYTDRHRHWCGHVVVDMSKTRSVV